MDFQGDRSDASATRILLAGWQAPDLLGMGVMVCDASGRIWLANQTAQDLLKTGDGVELSLEGRVCESDRRRHKLADTIRNVALMVPTASRRENGSSAIVIRRSRTSPLTLLISPFRGAPTRNPSQSLILLLVLGEGAAADADICGIERLYRLTPSEARLATLLMDGHSFKDCCQILRRNRTAANKDLQGLYKKTGARRPVELVSLLIKSKGLAQRQGGPAIGEDLAWGEMGLGATAGLASLLHEYSE